MVGWQVEAGRGREEGRNVGRPDASNVRFVRNCAVAAEGGREARQQPRRRQPARPTGEEGVACGASRLPAGFLRLTSNKFSFQVTYFPFGSL